MGWSCLNPRQLSTLGYLHKSTTPICNEVMSYASFCLTFKRQIKPSCLANQYVKTYHSGSSDAHSTLKPRKSCGMKFPISIIEMFFPMQLLEP